MLLVYGPRSIDYDFGPDHPLTPRRFGPGIDLLRAIGAEPGLAPEPAPDADLLLAHTQAYLEVIRGFSRDPYGFPKAGVGTGGDCPPFTGMHEASAAVAGGSLRAIEAILRGDVEHAQHPGGGLHHAMADRASGFCIYDDVALAIARARLEGRRVLYLDLDVHHGDGVQAIHWADPGVLTCSIHESGRTLFPGTGFADELGEGTAAGTAVNLPLTAGTGPDPWLAALQRLLPELAATFGPDVIVSQHGADSHAWDPLAHLAVTTTAMGAAARLIHDLAHRHAGGRWLATGGGGYDAYRVVPRAWAHVWLAGAHRDVPDATPAAWRDRWADEAARYGQAPLPEAFDDPADLGRAPGDGAAAAMEVRTAGLVETVRLAVIPRLVRAARDRGWWDPAEAAGAAGAAGRAEGPASLPAVGEPTIRREVDAASWAGLDLAPRVVAPFDPGVAHRIVGAALADGAVVTTAVQDRTVVGLVVVDAAGALLACGVAPGWRRRGLATALLVAERERADGPATSAEVSIGERDVVDPLDRGTRAAMARRLLAGAGFQAAAPDAVLASLDPGLLTMERPGGGRG